MLLDQLFIGIIKKQEVIYEFRFIMLKKIEITFIMLLIPAI